MFAQSSIRLLLRAAKLKHFLLNALLPALGFDSFRTFAFTSGPEYLFPSRVEACVFMRSPKRRPDGNLLAGSVADETE